VQAGNFISIFLNGEQLLNTQGIKNTDLKKKHEGESNENLK